MKKPRKSFYSGALWLVAICFIQPLSAAPVVFTIDSSQTQVAASGSVAGGTLTAQGPGALSTSYSGSINAELTGSTIQFTGASTITALNSGNWQPDEDSIPDSTAPANYGPKATVLGFVQVVAALRNIVLDLTSPETIIIGGSFPASNLVFSSTSPDAVIDYYSGLTSGGSLALNGYATNAIATEATITSIGSTQTLVIPIDATFYFSLVSANDTAIHLTGQLVATSSVTAPPVIHSIAVANQNVMVTAENVTDQSQLLVSTNLTAWEAASATITTNNSGWIIFTTPLNGPQAFYRVEQ